MGKNDLAGGIAFASNTPNMPTGYGTQSAQLIERMADHGLKVASLSNYGLEGTISEITVGKHTIPHYPKGFANYSQDVISQWVHHFDLTHDQRTALFTLYDVWVYESAVDSWRIKNEPIPIISWIPLDHVSLPPAVAAFTKRENVTPITMSPHGQRQLEKADIASTYIPHAIDLNVYKPTQRMHTIDVDAREYILGNRKDDVFLVGLVSANKANGIVHRKSLAENFMAFSAFHAKHPDAVLYVHSEVSPIMGGFTLPALAQACGIPPAGIIFPDIMKMRLGYSNQDMAAIYSACDVLLHSNMGEGFGLTALESMACETSVITSSWCASADFVSEDCYLVEGQPWWNEPMKAITQIPLISSIYNALDMAYKRGRMRSPASREFAKQFDSDKVFDEYWLPFLKGYFQ